MISSNLKITILPNYFKADVHFKLIEEINKKCHRNGAKSNSKKRCIFIGTQYQGK